MSLYALAAHPSVWVKCPWVAASPMFVSFLLLFVSGELLVKQLPGLSCAGMPWQASPSPLAAGVPTLEKSHSERYAKRDDEVGRSFRKYKAETNLLVPGPKKAS